jgi:hypothetical protein
MALYILISVLLGVKSKARVDTSYLNGNGKKGTSWISDFFDTHNELPPEPVDGLA